MSGAAALAILRFLLWELAVVTPGFDWRAHYGRQLAAWGYVPRKEVETGALLVRR